MEKGSRGVDGDETDISARRTDTRPGSGGRLALALGIYTGLRLALVVIVAAAVFGLGKAVGVTVPLLVAILFGLVIALPVGMVAFKKPRARVNEAIAEVDESRRTKRADLEARLRGGEPGARPGSKR
ncbi:DUF4229 domain-containing protein [Williamsia sterculiae]|uniref:DUF4229 domain-containing protein n=1 Tax=Williamsia sterculiae TaxID=1344003 RepID=UPI001F410CEF|nr:DUF4229 domain-containing protein [Williamsia sterculiae]